MIRELRHQLKNYYLAQPDSPGFNILKQYLQKRKDGLIDELVLTTNPQDLFILQGKVREVDELTRILSKRDIGE